MFGNVVKLVFQSASVGSGLDDFISKTKAGLTSASKLAQGVSILGSQFGLLGASAGKVASMLLQGGVWGAATEGVRLVVESIKKWRTEAALAAEAQSKAFKATVDSANAAADQIKSAYQKTSERIDAEAKKKIEAIELTKKQTKAELELAAAKAKAAGNEKAAKAIERKVSASDAGAAESVARISVSAAKEKKEEALKTGRGLQFVDKDGNFDRKAWYDDVRKRNGRLIRLNRSISEADKQNLSAVASAADPGGTKKKMVDVNDIKKELEMEMKARAKTIENGLKALQVSKNVAEAERALTAARKEERIAIVENQKSIVIAKAAAAQASKEEQLKRYQEQRSSLSTRRTAASSEVSRWQSEFNTAFDLWRDPDAAAAAVDADRKRGEDLKRFRKAVNRYGGKGKIDEYAALMRAGDEEGMQDRLAQWRKSSKFTPQVEQMVKAAAADQNRNAAEKSLANIEKNTADLAKKIDELLSLK